MTTELWLEFDEDKLSLLRREAYELDLDLETYLSEMLEDMISFNGKNKTEDELNMEKYKETKWKCREVEEPALYRFMEQWGSYIDNCIEEYFYIDEDDEDDTDQIRTHEGCIDYVLTEKQENIEEEMEFPCERLIRQVIEDTLKSMGK